MRFRLPRSLVLGLGLLCSVSAADALAAERAAPTQRTSYDVDVELCLLVDESSSIDSREWALQRDGYVAAFRSPEVKRLIARSNGVAVQYAVFARFDQQQGLGWRILRTDEDSEALADEIAASGRRFSRYTGVADALVYGMGQIAHNDITSRRQVIDVSGDGVSSNYKDWRELKAKREKEEAEGKVKEYKNPSAPFADWEKMLEMRPENLTINGISIGTSSKVIDFYRNELGLGPHGFVLNAQSFETFGEGIQAKLIREITKPVEAISFD